jgi:hypothetical protein
MLANDSAMTLTRNVSLRCHLDAATGQGDTFTVMKPSVDHLRSSMLARRYNVVALAVVLCVWLVAAAMHLHLVDKDAGAADPRPCTYCLAFSGGAAPLPDYRIPEVFAQPVAVEVRYDLPSQEQVATSFYLSRGPPAV